MAVLVTGGAGYIGSHTCVELLNAGMDVVIVDNLCNSKRQAVKRIEEITGKSVTFYKEDICDKAALQSIFAQEKIESIIHFAGLKAVGESCQKPLLYYSNNLIGTLRLCEVMQEHNVKTIVFSSSATVYGDPHTVPIKEDFPLSTTNPYGATKLMIENMLKDIFKADNSWNIALLRYFNPVGAHKSGLIGENPNGIPNNLVPYIAKVALGQLPELSVFGNDYPTPDGTGVRDYIHVVDLAVGHIKALEKIQKDPGLHIWNLGTGRGFSVLEMVKTFEQASGQKVPYKIAPRRAGDIAICYADTQKAEQELGWKAQRGLLEMCQDVWNWQQKNPQGYTED